jgi:hypothetical protein
MRATVVPLLLGLCACQAAEPVEPEFRDDTHVVLKRSGCLHGALPAPFPSNAERDGAPGRSAIIGR